MGRSKATCARLAVDCAHASASSIRVLPNHQRKRQDFLQHAPRARLEEAVWPALEAYHAAHGHLRVPRRHRDDVEGVHLGQVVSNIRSRRAFLRRADFVAWLRARGFRMHARDERADRAAWARVGASEA